MKRTLPEGRAAVAAKPSESQLTDPPSSRPSEEAAAAGDRLLKARAPHPAAVIRALAPTVAEWMAAGPTTTSTSTPEPTRFIRPEPPVSAVVERAVDESLAAVGLKPGDVVDRT